jgi:hypothetical protein
MKIVSEVYSEVGKAFVNTGLGVVLAALIAWLFTNQSVAWWKFPIGIALGLVQVLVGAWLIQAGYHIKKAET